ncbi:MAG: cupin domain-containing protein [Gemmatimonadaceae bacterium]|nr:cupin domain-containing protein [Acetobacteraceae bacterium]
MTPDPFQPRSLVRAAVDAPELRWLEGPVRMIALGSETGDRYQVETLDSHPGKGPAPHVHSREDEWYFVLSGGPITFTAGDQTAELGVGDFIDLRSGSVHAYKNTGKPARLVACNAPAGFERFQQELAASWPDGELDMEKIGPQMAELAPRYGLNLKPDPALFGQVPVVHVVRADAPEVEVTPGLQATVLAGPEHTGGRYAAIRLTLAQDASPVQLMHPVAATGLLVMAGHLRVQIAGRDQELSAEGFAHVEPGDVAILQAVSGRASFLVWHAPGLSVPFVGNR